VVEVLSTATRPTFVEKQQHNLRSLDMFPSRMIWRQSTEENAAGFFENLRHGYLLSIAEART